MDIMDDVVDVKKFLKDATDKMDAATDMKLLQLEVRHLHERCTFLQGRTNFLAAGVALSFMFCFLMCLCA